jgi:hypothetical protein
VLTASVASSLKREFDRTVGALGVPATWSRAKSPTPTVALTVGFKTAGVKDVEIVNAYGLNAIVITVRASDVSVSPEKFDSFTINGTRYIADDVSPILLNASAVGWKIYVKGTS